MSVLVKQCEECSFLPPLPGSASDPSLSSSPLSIHGLRHKSFSGGGSWSPAKWGSRGGGEGGRWVQRAAAAEGKRRNLPDGKRGGGGWEKVLPYIRGGEGTEEEEAK